MKKILGTILVAVAFAAVSTVDAKQMRNAKSMSASASNVAQVSQDALKGQATGQDVIDTVKQEAQTEQELKTIALMAEIKGLENRKDAINKQIKDLNLSWFGFRNTADQKAAYNDFKEELGKINARLVTAKNELRDNRKEVSRSWYDVSVLALKAAVAVGVPVAIIADLYYGTGYTKAAYTEVRSGMPRTRAAAGRAYQAGKSYAGRAYEAGKGYVSSAYEKLPNMRRGTTMPTETSAERVSRVTSEYYNQ